MVTLELPSDKVLYSFKTKRVERDKTRLRKAKLRKPPGSSSRSRGGKGKATVSLPLLSLATKDV